MSGKGTSQKRYEVCPGCGKEREWEKRCRACGHDRPNFLRSKPAPSPIKPAQAKVPDPPKSSPPKVSFTPPPPTPIVGTPAVPGPSLPLRAAQQQRERERLDRATAVYVRDLLNRTQEGESEACRAIDELIALGPRGVLWIVEAVNSLPTGEAGGPRRSCAAYVLGQIGDGRAVDALASLLTDAVGGVRRNAEAALRDIGGERAAAVLKTAGFRKG